MSDSTAHRDIDHTIVLGGIAIIAMLFLAVLTFAGRAPSADPATRMPTEEERHMALSKSWDYGSRANYQSALGYVERANDLRSESDYWQCRSEKPKAECDNLR